MPFLTGLTKSQKLAFKNARRRWCVQCRSEYATFSGDNGLCVQCDTGRTALEPAVEMDTPAGEPPARQNKLYRDITCADCGSIQRLPFRSQRCTTCRKTRNLRRYLPVIGAEPPIPLCEHGPGCWESGLADMSLICAMCGSTQRITADHINPLHNGGVFCRWNLQPLCHSCNCSKQHRLIETQLRL